jgi:hypothetical protein
MPRRRMGEGMYRSTFFLDLDTNWEWSASHPVRFVPETDPRVPIG